MTASRSINKISYNPVSTSVRQVSCFSCQCFPHLLALPTMASRSINKKVDNTIVYSSTCIYTKTLESPTVIIVTQQFKYSSTPQNCRQAISRSTNTATICRWKLQRQILRSIGSPQQFNPITLNYNNFQLTKDHKQTTRYSDQRYSQFYSKHKKSETDAAPSCNDFGRTYGDTNVFISTRSTAKQTFIFTP